MSRGAVVCDGGDMMSREGAAQFGVGFQDRVYFCLYLVLTGLEGTVIVYFSMFHLIGVGFQS